MSLKTKLLELFKYEPDKDGAQSFNIKSALNDNWDKIEAWAQSVKNALAKLVPTSRTVNGKTLAKDVTLTAADIKMPNSEEDVGAAMAKRLRYDDNLGFKIKLKAHKSLEYMSFDSGEETDLNYSGGCLTLPGWRSGPWGMQVRYDMRWNTLFTRRYFNEGSEWDDWVRLATCMPPEVHELPLADGWQAYGEGLCWYTRNQFKEVTIGMLLRSTSALTSDGAQFATLPEGFRPKVTVIAPVNVTANDYSHSACHVTINPDGGVYLHFDASSLSGKTVIQLVCPVFHYPVG